MLETLLSSTQRGKQGYLLYVDFADATIGAKTIVDQSVEAITLPYRGESNPSNFGVVDLVGVGRCFQFNGTSYFFNPNNPLKDMSLGSYDIEIAYVKPSLTNSSIFSTGVQSAANERGIYLGIDQIANTSFQMFVNKGAADGGTFQRNYLPGVNSKALTEILIQKRSTGVTITNNSTGVSASFINFPIKGDSFLGIGGQPSAGIIFTGYLKYLKIKKIKE